MISINTNNTLTRDQMLAALTHVYLDLRLSLRAAKNAAEADLELLDAPQLVAESS